MQHNKADLVIHARIDDVMRQVCEALSVSVDMPATHHVDCAHQVASVNCFSVNGSGNATKRRSNALDQGPPAKSFVVEPEMTKERRVEICTGMLDEELLKNNAQAPLYANYSPSTVHYQLCSERLEWKRGD